MTIVGAHVAPEHPLAEAAALDAQCVQIFVGDPQAPKKPPRRKDAAELKASDIKVYVHAPYLINVCSPKNNIRWQSRTSIKEMLEVCAEFDAAGVIVHAGHADDDASEGIRRWKSTLEMLDLRSQPVPLLIENTAGGNNAVARTFDVLARFWEVAGPLGAGFCFDTCHAHAAGEDVSDAVERVLAITGRIDLLHCNDSRDPFGSGRDRHTNLGAGEVGADALRHMIRASKAEAIIVETPGGAEAMAKDMAFVREALLP